MPLIDLALLADAAFMRGLCAAFFFFCANLSFYLVMTMFMQRGLQIPPLDAMGTPVQLIKEFGTRAGFIAAVQELQLALYQREA